MPRNLQPYTIRRFKGINVWSSFVNLKPDDASDCLNVVPSNSGACEKMRLPVNLSKAIGGFSGGFVRFRQFLTPTTQSVIAQLGSTIYKFDPNWTPTLIDTNPLNSQGIFDFVESNNLFFASNGVRTFKYDGTSITKWGIDPPSAAPTIATAQAPGAVAKNIGAVSSTVTIAGGSGRTSNLVTIFTSTPHGVNPGDVIQITGCTPADFNGFVVVQDTPTASALDYIQVGPDENITGFGTLQDANSAGIFRYDNEVTVTTTSAHGLAVSNLTVIAGVTDATFDGTFSVTSVLSSTQFTYDQTGANSISGSGTETPAPSTALFTLGGRKYKISFLSEAPLDLEDEGNASAASVATGNLDGTLNVTVSGPAPTDPQVTSAILWSTVDGGGDFFFNQQITIAPLTKPIFQDQVPDSGLDVSRIAPLINNVPPIGKYLAKWQGRTIIMNLVGDPQGVAYTGYEAILEGRPESCCPPNNRLHLALGSSQIAGGGGTAAGFVMFARDNRTKQDSMYIQRGQLQDVTVDAPVQFSTFLQPLPWAIGCFSHYTIAETPVGLVWLASDKTIQVYDGVNAPQELSTNISPLLRLITVGTESSARGGFFNFLEREFYFITCAINSSTQANQIIFVDLDHNPETNIGIFRSDIAADDIGVIESTTNQNELILLAQGIFQQLLINSDTFYGYSDPVTTNPATPTPTLNAYWRSGPFGYDDPGVVKMHRWATVARNPNMSEFYVQPRLIGEDNNFQFPALLPLERIPDDGRFSINAKGRAVVLEVQFPKIDQSANMVYIEHNYIPLARR